IMLIGALSSIFGALIYQLRVQSDVSEDSGLVWEIVLGLAVIIDGFSLTCALAPHNLAEKTLVVVVSLLPRLIPFTFAFCLVFQGFACLGWAVLGPYNFRFSSFGSTCEMLFSLMNGDDVFATIRETEAPMQMFGYIYISTFITVFSFVLLFFSLDFMTTFFEVMVSDSFSSVRSSSSKYDRSS
ncbi:unnamed protein product, partial [Meganyctiphanes norvegica]